MFGKYTKTTTIVVEEDILYLNKSKILRCFKNIPHPIVIAHHNDIDNVNGNNDWYDIPELLDNGDYYYVCNSTRCIKHFENAILISGALAIFITLLGFMNVIFF